MAFVSSPRALVLLAIAAAVLAAGCGGGDDGDETEAEPPAGVRMAGPGSGEAVEPGTAMSPAGRIRPAVVGFLASGDPEVVCEVVTESFLSVAYGDRRACVDAQAPGSAARDVELKSVDTEGERAVVVAVPKGGPNDGERLEIELVLEDDTWLIDEITSDAPVGP